MTTYISSEAFEKKQKVKECKIIQWTKNRKWKNGQSELLSRCLAIIKG